MPLGVSQRHDLIFIPNAKLRQRTTTCHTSLLGPIHIFTSVWRSKQRLARSRLTLPPHLQSHP